MKKLENNTKLFFVMDKDYFNLNNRLKMQNKNFSHKTPEEIEYIYIFNYINKCVNNNFKRDKLLSIGKESFFNKLNHYQT